MTVDFAASVSPLPCPLLSSSIRPASVPMSRLTPHSAAHRMSDVKRFLYLRISGDSDSFDFMFTVTSERAPPPAELPRDPISYERNSKRGTSENVKSKYSNGKRDGTDEETELTDEEMELTDEDI